MGVDCPTGETMSRSCLFQEQTQTYQFAYVFHYFTLSWNYWAWLLDASLIWRLFGCSCCQAVHMTLEKREPGLEMEAPEQQCVSEAKYSQSLIFVPQVNGYFGFPWPKLQWSCLISGWSVHTLFWLLFIDWNTSETGRESGYAWQKFCAIILSLPFLIVMLILGLERILFATTGVTK